MKYQKRPISDILRSPKTVFTFKDICMLWKNNNQNSFISGLSYYVKTGQLYKIRKGIYAKDKNYNRQELATRIYTPSYISFETVLNKAGINFQYYNRIFIASYLTRELIIDNQTYNYKKVKNSVLTNPIGIELSEEKSTASPERAVLDTIYLNPDYHFDNLNPLNWELIFDMLPIYKNNRMDKKINEIYKNFKEEKL